MKDFEHLMTVWQNQPVKEQLSVDEALKQVKKGMSSLSRKLMWGIVTMVVAIVSVFIILFFLPWSWLTNIGMTIILVTILSYALLMIRDYRLIHQRDVTVNPSDYLQNLKEYRKNRAQLYGKLYYLYFLSLSIGLALYSLEVLNEATLLSKIAMYSLTIIWFLICTFYLRKRIAKNEEEKINLIVDRLERLKDQFAV